MPDTPTEATERFRALLLARSREERLKMGCSMSATARALVRASVLAQDQHAVVAFRDERLYQASREWLAEPASDAAYGAFFRRLGGRR